MPDWRLELNSRLAPLRLSPVREREIADELVDHLDERYRDLKSAGLGDAEAERIARAELDSNEVLTRAFAQAERAMPADPVVPGGGGGRIMGSIWQDVRYGARTLRRSPGVAVVAVLTLALGIGANSAMFELLSAVSLRPLPVADPHSLAEIRIADRRNATGSFRGRRPNLTYTLWEHIRAEQQVFSGVFAWGNVMLNLTTGGEAKYAQALWVSGEYFSVLGVQPVLGRLITPADDQRGCPTPGVVISHAFWQQHFGGEPGVVGRTLPIEGRQFEVLGVTPRSFSGVEVGRGFDVALPLCAEVILGGERASLPKSDHWWLAAMGRLKPGVTPEAATSQLQSISSGIFATTQPLTYVPEDAATYRAFRFGAFSSATGVSVLRGRYENPLWMLLAMTGLVLVIACANLANLLLARASVRAREMAVRLALGASRRRLVRQLMIENLLLAGAGAMAGIAIAHLASQGLVALLDAGRSVIFVDVRPDWRVLGFTTALGALTCLLFGLAPALRATRVAPGAVMKATGRNIAVNPARAGIGRVLVIVQVALSLVLVIGALLFVRTLRNLSGLDVGFSHSRVLTASIDMQSLNLDPDGIIGLRERVLERVKAVPGVESAALGDIVPLSGSGWNERVIAGSQTKTSGISNFNGASPGFFDALGTPIRAGRDFAPTDTRTSPKVAIVNETFVREILGGAEPLGQTFRIEVGPGQPVQTYEIVGLVKDSKYRNLREAFSPIAFVSLGQVADPGPFVTVFTRSSVPPASLIAPATRAIAEVDPRLIVDFDPLSDTVRMGLVLERLMATLAGFFGALAGLLAVIGLYGVLSYMVARRRAEIGIRMALGANRRSVIGLIVREAAVLLVIGLVAGAALALVATKRTSSLLFGLQPSDPLTLALGVTVLAIVALAASYWPARRASRLDPLVVLRDE